MITRANYLFVTIVVYPLNFESILQLDVFEGEF